MAAKSKKDIILELRKENPNITPEEAATQSNATLAYAKRILSAATAESNGEINNMGRALGIEEADIPAWHEWVVGSFSTPRALFCFKDHILHDKIFKGEY